MRAEQIDSSISIGRDNLAAAFSFLQGIQRKSGGRLAVPHIPGGTKHFRLYPYPASRRYKRR